jgi:hypothetical protein
MWRFVCFGKGLDEWERRKGRKKDGGKGHESEKRGGVRYQEETGSRGSAWECLGMCVRKKRKNLLKSLHMEAEVKKKEKGEPCSTGKKEEKVFTN